MTSDSGERTTSYAANSLSLAGAAAMGTGVMIGAGIFALTGQVAELAKGWFPFAFLAAAAVTGFSAYTYIKLANAYPSAGGIAMFLEKAYGRSVTTGASALLMYFSMVINESLVARTFGTYTTQLFDGSSPSWVIPALGIALLFGAFLINILGNRFVQTLSVLLAFIKVGGIAVFAIGGLWVSGLSFESVRVASADTDVWQFIGAVALGILAYKGFTTITNSGGEIREPHKNVGRAIVIAIVICVVVYVLVAFAVGGNLTIDEIIAARDYTLAEAARPAFGEFGVWFTVAFAIVATVSGVIASVFAVSRMLAMLTDMKLVPHSHFGMPGSVQTHTLVYTIVAAMVLTLLFDLSRIAALGAIFYIIMDIVVQWGVLHRLRHDVEANRAIVWTALVLDAVVLTALIAVKASTDMVVIYAAVVGLVLIVGGERLFLRGR